MDSPIIGILFYLSLALLFFALHCIERYHRFRHTEDLFARAYFFDRKKYRICNNRITLSPGKSSDNSISKAALRDSLTEYAYYSSSLSTMMQSSVIIQSCDPVWFHMDICLSFPFTRINASEVILLPALHGLLCSSVVSNPVIQELTFPKSLSQLNIDISCCPNLKIIRLPRTDKMIRLEFPKDHYTVFDVSSDFCIQVPSDLLEQYRSTYQSIAVKRADGQSSPLTFSPIPTSQQKGSEL